MSQPLDYRNPLSRQKPQGAPDEQPPRTVIPLEFDLLLTRTAEHAAARAIEDALRRAGVGVFRSDDGRHATREVELHIRAADRELAQAIAGQIFARRKKIKSYPPPQALPSDRETMDGGGFSV